MDIIEEKQPDIITNILSDAMQACASEISEDDFLSENHATLAFIEKQLRATKVALLAIGEA